MLVNCNSCQKNFTVPDSAITEEGRLLQCGSCGNKWIQYPIKNEGKKKEERKKVIPKITSEKIDKSQKEFKIKKKSKKKKREINLYSEEYLEKKHGIVIKDSSNKKVREKTSNTSFFNYLICTTIIIIAAFGILNMTKENLILNYPFMESYVDSLYEILEIFKITIFSLIH